MKKLASIVIAVALMIGVTVPVAANTLTPEVSQEIQDEIQPRPEETEWHYRYDSVTGKLQKRLWSLTYGKWLTDWIYV